MYLSSDLTETLCPTPKTSSGNEVPPSQSYFVSSEAEPEDPKEMFILFASLGICIGESLGVFSFKDVRKYIRQLKGIQ